MRVSIFIRSYEKDFPWLAFCLRSISKYSSGFLETVIAVPEKHKDSLTRGFGLTKEKVYGVPDIGEGYMAQQITKLHADQLCDGDYILFVDSDCCFNVPFSPETFFKDGKPWMLITPYKELGDAVPWKKITEKCLGFECKHETMRRLPILYPKRLLPSFRDWFHSQRGENIADYISRQPPRAFSEFNALGAWTLKHSPDSFTWIDTTEPEPLPPTILCQNWSWGGITPEILKKLQEVTA